MDALNNIQTIDKVHRLNDNTVELIINDDLDKTKADLLAMSQTNQWGLVEIYDIRETLENVFVSEVLRGAH